LAGALPPVGQQMRLVDCMNAIAARYPIFEGGTVRESVEALGLQRPHRHLSSTTSHALLRLVDEKVIELELLSDADGLILIDGTTTLPFSHIGRARSGEEVS
jgi:hypothetical protein